LYINFKIVYQTKSTTDIKQYLLIIIKIKEEIYPYIIEIYLRK
jgi:hypothetical protein